MLSKFITISAFAASASAHIIMNYPTPFGRATLNTSPLTPADFPCKQRNGVYAVDTMNQWDAGQTQTVSFNGTAVHGGGSCQFSITTDPEPTEKSQWKVIQSVVGGCPTGKFEGNAPEDHTREPMLTPVEGGFPVTMPADIPEGRYTFAWTWLNKVGNREFYMNCAPIQVGSGKSSASTASAANALAALPDMFVVNLPDTECSTAPSQDFVYPNPGKSVVKRQSGASGSTLTGSGCTRQNAMGAGAGSIGSPSVGAPSSPSQGTPSTPSQGTPSLPSNAASPPVASPIGQGPSVSNAPLNPGGVFAPGASPVPAAPSPIAQPAPPAKGPTPPVANSPPVAPEPPSTQPPNNTTPTNGQCTPCTKDGALVCMGDNQFGICDRGCAVPQAMAAGMSCKNGAAIASTKKRHIHFPRAHLHRRLSAAHLI